MKTYSKQTKKKNFERLISGLLSFLCVFGPLIYYTLCCLFTAQTVTMTKTIFVMTSVAAVIVAAVSAFRKLSLRSPLYIFMIGIWFALDNLLPFITTIAICTLLDELIFTPWYRRAKEDYHTNKQIDLRNLGE